MIVSGARFGMSTDGNPLKVQELLGSVLLVRPTGTRMVNARSGAVEAVIADVRILDGKHEGTFMSGYMFFNSTVTDTLRDMLQTGGVTVGRFREVATPSGVKIRHFSPLNMIAERELLNRAEAVARDQGWIR